MTVGADDTELLRQASLTATQSAEVLLGDPDALPSGTYPVTFADTLSNWPLEGVATAYRIDEVGTSMFHMAPELLPSPPTQLAPVEHCVTITSSKPKKCRFFARGWCRKGDKCKYLHVDARPNQMVEEPGDDHIKGKPGKPVPSAPVKPDKQARRVERLQRAAVSKKDGVAMRRSSAAEEYRVFVDTTAIYDTEATGSGTKKKTNNKNKKGKTKARPTENAAAVSCENWTAADVATWARGLGLPATVATKFRQQAIEGTELLDLTKACIVEIGVVKVGHVMKVLRGIKALQK